MLNLWDQVRNDLIWDGSLRDIYVKGTTLDDWNQFLSVIRETAQYQYFVDGQPTLLPSMAVNIFSIQEQTKLLSIWVGGVQLNCHFFAEKEIELDLDPQQITSEESFNALRQFMEQLADALQHLILLTPEDLSEYPIAKYEPELQCWHYFPAA
ncbi:MAG: hypothetical protein SFY66_00780 [Oculatellaceae cyanobacterium bins.114]|nr:hypothetical protein [Oculatellaceae cyanobacterium bins.114]